MVLNVRECHDNQDKDGDFWTSTCLNGICVEGVCVCDQGYRHDDGFFHNHRCLLTNGMFDITIVVCLVIFFVSTAILARTVLWVIPGKLRWRKAIFVAANLQFVGNALFLFSLAVEVAAGRMTLLALLLVLNSSFVYVIAAIFVILALTQPIGLSKAHMLLLSRSFKTFSVAYAGVYVLLNIFALALKSEFHNYVVGVWISVLMLGAIVMIFMLVTFSNSCDEFIRTKLQVAEVDDRMKARFQTFRKRVKFLKIAYINIASIMCIAICIPLVSFTLCGFAPYTTFSYASVVPPLALCGPIVGRLVSQTSAKRLGNRTGWNKNPTSKMASHTVKESHNGSFVKSYRSVLKSVDGSTSKETANKEARMNDTAGLNKKNKSTTVLPVNSVAMRAPNILN